MQMQGKVALITGAGQGIGRAIAGSLIAAGCQVVLAEVDAEAGREAEAELRALGEARFVHTDVSEEASVRRAIEEVMSTFARLDALVNNAGVFEMHPFPEVSLADWHRVLGVNLTGPFLCAKYAAPHLKATRGAIVNIASTRALMSEANNEAYGASKGGLVALTHAMAISLAPDVRVNCVSPGWIDVSDWKKRSSRNPAHLRDIDHAQHPAGRVGTPEDVARLVSYLVSPDAAFVTGQNFVIDGGMTKKMTYAE